MTLDRLRDALDLVTGIAALGAGLAYAGTLFARLVLRRRVSFERAVIHGAGAGFLVGLWVAMVLLWRR